MATLDKQNSFTKTEAKRFFMEERPYYSLHEPIVVLEKSYDKAEQVVLHQHNTLELNICEGVKGTVCIEGKQYRLENCPVLLMPPRAIHSYDIKPQGGRITVEHISLDTLGQRAGRKQRHQLYSPRQNQAHSGALRRDDEPEPVLESV